MSVDPIVRAVEIARLLDINDQAGAAALMGTLNNPAEFVEVLHAALCCFITAAAQLAHLTGTTRTEIYDTFSGTAPQ
jgi:hypothetical protein